MAKVIFSNRAAVRMRRAERERIREFYLGCKIKREFDNKDDFQIGDVNIAFLYAKVTGGGQIRA
jgi:hypothetical protein